MAAAVDVTRVSNKTEKMAVMLGSLDGVQRWSIFLGLLKFSYLASIMPNWCYNSLTVTTTGNNDGEKIWFGKMAVSPTSPT